MEKARLIETLEAMQMKNESLRKLANKCKRQGEAYGYAFSNATISVVIGMLESDVYAEKIRAAYIKEGE